MKKCRVCQTDNSDDTVFCKTCGLQLSDGVIKKDTYVAQQVICPNCGEANTTGTRYCGNCAQPLTREAATQIPGQRVTMLQENRNSGMPVAKLCLGIISIALSLLVLFQSYIVLVSNTFADNGSTEASFGMLIAICLLTAGIVAIAARRSRGGAVASMLLYGIAAYTGAIAPVEAFTDIIVWTWVCAVLCLIFFVSIFSQKYEG